MKGNLENGYQHSSERPRDHQKREGEMTSIAVMLTKVPIYQQPARVPP